MMAPPPTIHGRPGASEERSSNPYERAAASQQRKHSDRNKAPPDLLCRVRYLNTLPDIPFQPKFLSCPFVDMNRFVDYKQTSLEKNYKYDLLTEPDLGVKIDLIDPDTYHIDYKDEVKMHEMDERLLEDDASNPQDTKRSRQHSKIVPWMRKTEYISSEFNRFGTSSDRQETKVGWRMKKQMQDDNMYRDRDSQLEAISRTFEDVQRPVTQHYSKPNVTAIEELPLFPDLQLWKYPFAQVIFDADPAPVDLPIQISQQKMCQALIRGMMDETGEQFVAYFMPTDDTIEKRKRDVEEGMKYKDEEEYEYKMAREYNWTVKNKATKGYEQENYFFVLRDGAVHYNELETRVRLTRRRAKEGQPRLANSRLVVKHREENEQELFQQTIREKGLLATHEEEEPEPMETNENEKENQEQEEPKEKDDDDEEKDKEEEKEESDDKKKESPKDKESDNSSDDSDDVKSPVALKSSSDQSSDSD